MHEQRTEVPRAQCLTCSQDLILCGVLEGVPERHGGQLLDKLRGPRPRRRRVLIAREISSHLDQRGELRHFRQQI